MLKPLLPKLHNQKPLLKKLPKKQLKLLPKM